MRFEPKTEKEIAEAGLMPAGVYDFEVLEAEEAQSAAKNDMITLKLRVYDTDGRGHFLKDWLVSTDGGAFKIRHFAETTNMLPQYENGELKAEALPGLTGRCKVGIKKDPNYPDQNNIRDYAPGTTASAPRSTAAGPRDEIPFADDAEIPF